MASYLVCNNIKLLTMKELLDYLVPVDRYHSPMTA